MSYKGKRKNDKIYLDSPDIRPYNGLYKRIKGEINKWEIRRKN